MWPPPSHGTAFRHPPLAVVDDGATGQSPDGVRRQRAPSPVPPWPFPLVALTGGIRNQPWRNARHDLMHPRRCRVGVLLPCSRSNSITGGLGSSTSRCRSRHEAGGRRQMGCVLATFHGSWTLTIEDLDLPFAWLDLPVAGGCGWSAPRYTSLVVVVQAALPAAAAREVRDGRFFSRWWSHPIRSVNVFVGCRILEVFSLRSDHGDTSLPLELWVAVDTEGYW